MGEEFLCRVPLPMPRHWKNTRSARTLIQSVNNFLKTVWTWHTVQRLGCDNTGLLGAHNMGASDGRLSPSQSSSSVTRQHVGGPVHRTLCLGIFAIA